MSLVEKLYKNYGSFSLDIPRWEILDEGVTALWGPSGSGKTSVFRILIGLDQCKGMRWSYKGENLAALKSPERRLGVVFQSLELFPHMTAMENIWFAVKARNVSDNEAQVRLKELVELLDMKGFLNRDISVLSGGERQRVALARAIIGRPQLLFLDEPFSALDENLKEGARELVKQVIENEKIPTILITHDQRDIDFLADKVSEMDNGRIVKEYYVKK